MCQADVLQHLDLAGIAIDDRVSGLPADADTVRIEVEGDVLETRLFEHPRDVLADTPETANDHVIAFRDSEGCLRLSHGFAVRRPGFPEQSARDPAIVPDEQGREDHAEDDGRQQGLGDAGIEQFAPQYAGSGARSRTPHPGSRPRRCAEI